MIENIKWCLWGLVIGMGVSAVVVATNKKIQNKISDSIDMTSQKISDLKDCAVKSVKKAKSSSSSKSASKTA